QVSARYSVAPGHEAALALDDTGGHAAHAASTPETVCSPTWVQPAKGGRANRYVYVPCNKAAEVLEIDAERWEITRRFPSGAGPYNMDVTPDGRLLLVTLKGGQGVQVIDLETGEERARIATTQPVTHGVVVTPDGRYAFVTNEAIGSTRGTVDVIDLARLERVARRAVAPERGWSAGRGGSGRTGGGGWSGAWGLGGGGGSFVGPGRGRGRGGGRGRAPRPGAGSPGWFAFGVQSWAPGVVGWR